MSSDTLVEPSNDEQSQWPEATENYVRGLEERIKALEAALRRCFKGETQAVRNERVLEAIENHRSKP